MAIFNTLQDGITFDGNVIWGSGHAPTRPDPLDAVLQAKANEAHNLVREIATKKGQRDRLVSNLRETAKALHPKKARTQRAKLRDLADKLEAL